MIEYYYIQYLSWKIFLVQAFNKKHTLSSHGRKGHFITGVRHFQVTTGYRDTTLSGHHWLQGYYIIRSPLVTGTLHFQVTIGYRGTTLSGHHWLQGHYTFRSPLVTGVLHYQVTISYRNTTLSGHHWLQGHYTIRSPLVTGALHFQVTIGYRGPTLSGHTFRSLNHCMQEHYTVGVRCELRSNIEGLMEASQIMAEESKMHCECGMVYIANDTADAHGPIDSGIEAQCAIVITRCPLFLP